MTVVVIDASVVIAALLDTGTTGAWAEQLIGAHQLAAPHLMPVEAASVLRRAAVAGDVAPASASLAHRDLGLMQVELFPYGVCADRAWQLRGNVTSYDGWYVALAELLEAPLATLDARLSRAAGPRCSFVLPST